MKVFILSPNRLLLCLASSLLLMASGLHAVDKPKMHVLPLSFTTESEKQYGDWINKLKEQGFGNAVWLEIEAILEEEGTYELIMSPDQSDAMRDLIASIIAEQTGADPSDPIYEKPEYLIQINSNFFVREEEKMKGFRTVSNTIFSVTIYLRHYELKHGKLNVGKTALGSAEAGDPISAAREASKAAVNQLLGLL